MTPGVDPAAIRARERRLRVGVAVVLFVAAAAFGGGAFAVGAGLIGSKDVRNRSLKEIDFKPPKIKFIKQNPESPIDPCIPDPGPVKAGVFCGSAAPGEGWWRNAGGYRRSGFYKAGGEVHLTGFVAATNFTTPTAIFVLPKRYRPDGQLAFDTGCDAEGASEDQYGACLVTVDRNGYVAWADGVFYGKLILEGISFVPKG